MPKLKLVIPEEENENLSIDTIPFILGGVDLTLSVAEIAGVSAEAFEFGALGVVGFGFSIGAAVVGQWAALGSGYAEAWEKIRADREAMGFSYGVVMAIDGRSGKRTARYFGERSPESYLEPSSGRVAQKAFNKGLANGWVQGRTLSNNQKQRLLRDLITRAGKMGTITGEQTKSWGDGEWRVWYQDLGIAFRRFHIGH